MRNSPGFLTSIVLLALIAGCATQTQPPAAALSASSPPPAGSQRLPGSHTCESEVPCSACADDHDRELVRYTFLIHAAEVRACLERVAPSRPGTERRIVRLGIDPTAIISTASLLR